MKFLETLTTFANGAVTFLGYVLIVALIVTLLAQMVQDVYALWKSK